MPTIFSPEKCVKRDEDIKKLSNWNLNVFEIPLQEKLRLTYAALAHHGVFERYKVELERFCQFLCIITDKYNDNGNAFHNFDHGFSGYLLLYTSYPFKVMQAAFYFTVETSITKYIKPIDTFALLISALCHDVGHTGRTNIFEINTMSKLAIRYHDKSVNKI